MAQRRWTWCKVFFLAIGLAIVIGGVYLIQRVFSDRPVVYADAADHFRHGSTGGERGYHLQPGFGLPYWLWIALPEVFPDLLPDGRAGRGYTSFGMLYEPGHDPRFEMPIGMSMRLYQGVDRVYFNCAVCHTGSVRDSAAAAPRYVLGMPANTFDLGRVGQFLFDVAADERFTATWIMPHIRDLAERRRKEYPESVGYRPAEWDFLNRFIFNLAGIQLVRDRLLNIRGQLSFVDTSRWGPGRVDTFNSPKALLGFNMDGAPPQELIGIVDLPSVWFQKGREGMWLHWDGNNNSVDERNLSAGFGTGATPTTIDKAGILRMAAFLWDQAEPPAFPADRINNALVERGEWLYEEYCLECHGYRRPPFKGEKAGQGTKVGTVVDIGEIGTDRWRLDSYTAKLAAAQNTLYAGYPRIGEAACEGRWDDKVDCYPARFRHFRKTNGYANMPLDGLWLRAPYLHNGSVPNLRGLFAPSAQRPPTFYIGNDVYDYVNVGFVTDQPEGNGRRFFKIDTQLPGNGNQGHEGPAFGTELAPADKDALIEYLKTF